VAVVAGLLSVAGQALAESGGPAEEPVPVMASSRISAEHLQQYSDLAVTWMQEYLRVDTTNPPGNEMRAVAFYKKILDQDGIENRVFEYAPGRGDLWARVYDGASSAANHPAEPYGCGHQRRGALESPPLQRRN
jgi:acetylornithine deacetylase/succinyl-diaminopimelate desuccinylase-like protein